MLPLDLIRYTLTFFNNEEYCKICDVLEISPNFNQYFKYHKIPKMIEICKFKYECRDLIEFAMKKRKRSSEKLIKCMKKLISRGHTNIIIDWYNKFNDVFVNKDFLMDKAAYYGQYKVIKALKSNNVSFTKNMMGMAIDRAGHSNYSMNGKYFDVIEYLYNNDVPINREELKKSYVRLETQHKDLYWDYVYSRCDLKTSDGFLNLYKSVKTSLLSCRIHAFLLKHVSIDLRNNDCGSDNGFNYETEDEYDRLSTSECNNLIQCKRELNNDSVICEILSFLSGCIEEYSQYCEFLCISPIVDKYYDNRKKLPNIEDICYGAYRKINADTINYLLTNNEYSDDILLKCMDRLISCEKLDIIEEWYCNKFNDLFKNKGEYLMNISAGKGKINVIKLLKNMGVNYTFAMMSFAIRGSYIKVIKHLYLDGISIEDREIDVSIARLNKKLCRFREKYIVGGGNESDTEKNPYYIDSGCLNSGFPAYFDDIKEFHKQFEIHEFLLKYKN